jgi:hypothetical protein
MMADYPGITAVFVFCLARVQFLLQLSHATERRLTDANELYT